MPMFNSISSYPTPSRAASTIEDPHHALIGSFDDMPADYHVPSESSSAHVHLFDSDSSRLPAASDAASSNRESRRRSLPVDLFLPSLWSSNTAAASVTDSNYGEHIGEYPLDDTTAGHHASALRQLNGLHTRSRHHQHHHHTPKSPGPPSSVSSQPVIVRTYNRPSSRHSSRPATPASVREHYRMYSNTELPPIEEFAFDGILRAIEPEVRSTIDAIAEICARSRTSLADEYGAHLPPVGDVGRARQARELVYAGRGQEQTLTAVAEASSSNERLADESRAPNQATNTNSAAYGSLENIMTSSISREATTDPAQGTQSNPADDGNGVDDPRDEDDGKTGGKTGDKNGGEIAENGFAYADESREPTLSAWRRGHTPKSKSGSWAFGARGWKPTYGRRHSQQLVSPMNLISEFASPEQLRMPTVLAAEVSDAAVDRVPSSRPENEGSTTGRMPNAPSRRNSFAMGPLLFRGLTSWLPWIGDERNGHTYASASASSSDNNAEHSLRGLLQSANGGESKGSDPAERPD
ncbi:MAG: hypothetical protein M1819_006037 [Sarea resinae]|nr:MAG: hypothetical protein M1819_006037 [Sarea resinae]